MPRYRQKLPSCSLLEKQCENNSLYACTTHANNCGKPKTKPAFEYFQNKRKLGDNLKWYDYVAIVAIVIVLTVLIMGFVSYGDD